MKSLIRVSSIFIVLSIAFASETKEELVSEVQVNNTEASDQQLIQSDVIPIDIEKIKNVRIKKSIREKKYAESVLKKQQASEKVKQDFVDSHVKKAQEKSVFKKWASDARSKLSIITLKGENGEKAIKLPSAPESN